MILAAQNSRLYENAHPYNAVRQKRMFVQPANILVVNGDCLDTVQSLKNKIPELNPVVLNMANAFTPGGGWRDGS